MFDVNLSSPDESAWIRICDAPEQAYRERIHVSVQLAVVSRLDVAAVVLVEVGEAVVHEDAALSVKSVRDKSFKPAE